GHKARREEQIRSSAEHGIGDVDTVLGPSVLDFARGGHVSLCPHGFHSVKYTLTTARTCDARTARERCPARLLNEWPSGRAWGQGHRRSTLPMRGVADECQGIWMGSSGHLGRDRDGFGHPRTRQLAPTWSKVGPV